MWKRFHNAYQKRNFYAIHVKPDHINRCSAACSRCGLGKSPAYLDEISHCYTSCVLTIQVVCQRLGLPHDYSISQIIYIILILSCIYWPKSHRLVLSLRWMICNGSASYNIVKLGFLEYRLLPYSYLRIPCRGLELNPITPWNYKW